MPHESDIQHRLDVPSAVDGSQEKLVVPQAGVEELGVCSEVTHNHVNTLNTKELLKQITQHHVNTLNSS